MRITIIANGEINDYRAAQEAIPAGSYIIACDGGLRHVQNMGIIPHCIIGDMDSAPPETLSAYNPQNVPLIIYPAEKDDTDLSLAINHAQTKNPASVIILGALGGRVDHALANLHMLAQIPPSITAEIRDETTSISLIRPGAAVKLCKSGYQTISLIPLTTEVTGVTTKGLYYPLNNETLTAGAGASRGVSNTFTEESAEVAIKSGLLLAIRCR